MEKKKKPWYVVLFNILLTIICIIVLVVGGIFLFFKIKYDVNVFSAISQIRMLNETVNEDELFPNKYTEVDIASAQVMVNSQIENLIVKNDNGYTIDTTGITDTMDVSIYLTDKEIGAIVNVLLIQNNQNAVNIGGKTLPFELIQVKFDNNVENSADVNIVLKVNVEEIKNEMNSFPLSWVKKYIPNDLYFSSTVTVTKGTNAYEYTTTSKSLTINNLNVEQTTSLLKTINTFVSFGNENTINELIGNTFVDALIGTEENQGFAYSLKSLGASDFTFTTQNDKNYFVIVK